MSIMISKLYTGSSAVPSSLCCLPVAEWINGTIFIESLWLGAEKWLVVAVLALEMIMGVVGNSLVLLVKVKVHSLFAMLTGGQRSPWCEVVSLLKFAFISSSIGSIAAHWQGLHRTLPFVVMVTACSAFWLTGMVFGIVPVVYNWIRYDPAEMLCAVFWESSYSDMLVYILCAFFICIFLPSILIFICLLLRSTRCCTSSETLEISEDEADLSAVTPLLVATYMLCYTPFAVAELILLGKLDLSPAPNWLRTLSSVMSYLDCAVNPLIYFSHQDFRETGLALLWTNRKPPSEPVLTAVTNHEL
ncbi:hypothetical protein Q5P01_025982 [Channa striata]|uniref:G-protein coupled receptors family 1 profile domain-containing protein n=1 Tax=Channa striata TaxID=64152 RepID=A0AA88IZ62_CHASR|nr:hypothetical protein Q5P01_025982 [Channa striata]